MLQSTHSSSISTPEPSSATAISSPSRFRLIQLWRRKPPLSDLPLYLQNVHNASERRIDRFVMLTITVTGLAILLTPILVLAYTELVALKLTIITIFIMFFLVFVSFGANAKPYESPAATAAWVDRVVSLLWRLVADSCRYATIQMVFLQSYGIREWIKVE